MVIVNFKCIDYLILIQQVVHIFVFRQRSLAPSTFNDQLNIDNLIDQYLFFYFFNCRLPGRSGTLPSRAGDLAALERNSLGPAELSVDLMIKCSIIPYGS